MQVNMLPPGPKGKSASDSRTKQDEETGSNSLEQDSPNDIHADERVIVNEQRESKIVNTPSQSAANTSEGSSYDDEI